jgi:hypothetical protein
MELCSSISSITFRIASATPLIEVSAVRHLPQGDVGLVDNSGFEIRESELQVCQELLSRTAKFRLFTVTSTQEKSPTYKVQEQTRGNAANIKISPAEKAVRNDATPLGSLLSNIFRR